jgi:hypothetical protein
MAWSRRSPILGPDHYSIRVQSPRRWKTPVRRLKAERRLPADSTLDPSTPMDMHGKTFEPELPKRFYRLNGFVADDRRD